MENLKLKEAIKKIDEAIKFAIKNGFQVCVASDEEGNGWNELNNVSYPMFYNANELKPNKIVLGVYRSVDESDLFTNKEE